MGVGQEGTHGSKTKLCAVFSKSDIFRMRSELEGGQKPAERCIDKWIMRQENRILYRSPHTSTTKNNLMRGNVQQSEL